MVPRQNKNNDHAKFGGTNKEYSGIFQSGLLLNELRFVFQGIQVQYVALIALKS